MENPRTIGLALIALGVLAFLGTTYEVLPQEAFWAGLLTYPFGGYLFFKGSRAAIQEAEHRASRAVNPRIRNDNAEHHAKFQHSGIQNRGTVDDLAQRARRAGTVTTPPIAPVAGDELVLYDVDDPNANDLDGDVKISTDVSFPIEVQQHDSLATQLEKLQRLHRDGILNDEEMAIAKAKLLS